MVRFLAMPEGGGGGGVRACLNGLGYFFDVQIFFFLSLLGKGRGGQYSCQDELPSPKRDFAFKGNGKIRVIHYTRSDRYV